VAHEHDDRLRYAASAVPGLAILTYHVTFQLLPVPDVPVRKPPKAARCGMYARADDGLSC